MVPEKLKCMGIGLDKWFRKLTCSKKVTVKELKSRLAQLNAMSPTEDTLVDDTCNSFDTNDKILRDATDYFKVLFESNGCNPPGRILEGIQPCIEPSLNGDLDKYFCNEEVLTALKSMRP
ncbi:hypothetical protein GQ457_05G016470 [Hibiscus cannabinus]